MQGRSQGTLKGAEPLEGLYDFVLIDCAPSFGATTLNALTAADLLLIPMQCEYYAARSLWRMLKLVRLIRQKTNTRLRYQVLVTLYDRRNRICRIIREQLHRELGHVLFETEIEVDTKLRESPAYGRPITLYAPKSRGAEQYRALARELIEDRGSRDAEMQSQRRGDAETRSTGESGNQGISPPRLPGPLARARTGRRSGRGN